MRFLADENVEREVVRLLRKRGHDVAYVSEGGASAPDEEVLERARRERRILLTNDKDFGELVFLQRRLATGVLLLRLEEERGRDSVREIRKIRDSETATVEELVARIRAREKSRGTRA